MRIPISVFTASTNSRKGRALCKYSNRLQICLFPVAELSVIQRASDVVKAQTMTETRTTAIAIRTENPRVAAMMQATNTDL